MGKKAKGPVQDHLESVLRGYLKDLPDSAFQEGYLACAVEMARMYGANDPRLIAATTALISKAGA